MARHTQALGHNGQLLACELSRGTPKQFSCFHSHGANLLQVLTVAGSLGEFDLQFETLKSTDQLGELLNVLSPKMAFRMKVGGLNRVGMKLESLAPEYSSEAKIKPPEVIPRLAEVQHKSLT